MCVCVLAGGRRCRQRHSVAHAAAFASSANLVSDTRAVPSSSASIQACGRRTDPSRESLTCFLYRRADGRCPIVYMYVHLSCVKLKVHVHVLCAHCHVRSRVLLHRVYSPSAKTAAPVAAAAPAAADVADGSTPEPQTTRERRRKKKTAQAAAAAAASSASTTPSGATAAASSQQQLPASAMERLDNLIKGPSNVALRRRNGTGLEI